MWTQDSTRSLICIDTWNNQNEGCEFLTQIYCCCSVDKLWHLVTPWTAVCQASLSSTISWSLLKFMSIESVMLSNHLILCHPFLLLPSLFPSVRGLFQWVSSSHQGIKVLELQLQSFSEYVGLISFRTDWFDLLAVQGTLKSLLQHHYLKASILQWWLALNFVVWLIGISIKVYI